MFFSVPSEEQGLIVPEFETDDENDDEQDTVNSLEKKFRNNPSVFTSVFGGKLLKKNPSIISLNSANFENETEESKLWQGSAPSLVAQDYDTLTEKNKYGSSDQASQGIQG